MTQVESRPGVRVESLRLDWAEALAQGDAVFSDRFGIPVEPGWTGFPDALPILLDAARAGVDPRWGPQLFFDSDGALVGNGGWKGPPNDGVVELGYAVAPSRQRRGIATTVVRELLERARRADVRTVRAHTLAEENASTRVLRRCGLAETAELDDPDEGPVWRWEVDLRPGIRVADPSEFGRPRGRSPGGEPQGDRQDDRRHPRCSYRRRTRREADRGRPEGTRCHRAPPPTWPRRSATPAPTASELPGKAPATAPDRSNPSTAPCCCGRHACGRCISTRPPAPPAPRPAPYGRT